MATTFALRATAVKTADKTGNREQGKEKTIRNSTFYTLHFTFHKARTSESCVGNERQNEELRKRTRRPQYVRNRV